MKKIDINNLRLNLTDIFSKINAIPSNKIKYNSSTKVYLDYYSHVIKINETKDHYNKFLNLINPFYEKTLISSIKKKNLKKNTEVKKIAFVLPNISNDLAHTLLLNDVINYEKAGIEKIIFSDWNKTISSKIEKSASHGFVKLIKCNFYNYNDLQSFITNHLHEIDRVVVWSLPTLVPLFTHIANDRVIYVSLKFELGCFNDLKNAIYFSDDLRGQKKIINNTNWYLIKNAFSYLHLNDHTKKINLNKIKFISINRPEKINNIVFLNAVKNILNKLPNSFFYWTGRQENIEIKKFFSDNKLEERVFFIGWVDVDKAINDYDIFLDTPNLSGFVAVNYFLSGMPVVSFKNCISHINRISQKVMENHKINISFDNNEDYLNHAIKLATDVNFNQKVKTIQKSMKNDMLKDLDTMNEDFYNIVMK